MPTHIISGYQNQNTSKQEKRDVFNTFILKNLKQIYQIYIATELTCDRNPVFTQIPHWLVNFILQTKKSNCRKYKTIPAKINGLIKKIENISQHIHETNVITTGIQEAISLNLYHCSFSSLFFVVLCTKLFLTALQLKNNWVFVCV